MTLPRIRFVAVASLVFGACLVYPALGQTPVAQETTTDLAPYAMLRSLQFVQDSVVQGDHSAGEMQRFMLGTMDQRLRSANAEIFNDPRNVDAALIYAMSGGNPATLEYLASRDIAGNFDNRVADALRKYLSGKGTLIAKSLGEMANEYKDQKIGPYLALVSGNVIVPKSPKDALVFYDWARLTAPGTIIEEAALRRSVAIAVEADMVALGLGYSRKYARRFVHSPYASQFADFFVQLVVEHFGEITEDDIDGTLSAMDIDRRREVLLRIGRAAAISGKNDLARLVSARAEKLSGGDIQGPENLARLYGGLADIGTADVGKAMKAIADIPQDTLSVRDQALREAAKKIAEEVMRLPAADSFAQESNDISGTAEDATATASPGHELAGNAQAAEPSAAGPTADPDPAFQTFVDSGRSKLSAIDDLLKESASQ